MDEKKPFENITLPDSLLSRFDLVFVVLDKTDDEFNRAISDHITRLHRYTPPGVEEGTPMTEDLIQGLKAIQLRAEDEEQATPVFQKFNELLHIGIRPSQGSRGRRAPDTVEILSIPFLKKYLYYAKNRIKPTLTQEACDFISSRYAELRAIADGKDEKYRTMPITPRTLETLIRLSTAHAKVRLSKTVDVADAEVAFELLVFALFKEVKAKKRVKRAKLGKESDVEEEDSDDETVASAPAPSVEPSVVSARTGTQKSVRSGATSSRMSELVNEMALDEDDTTVAGRSSVTTPALGAKLVGSRLASFNQILFKISESIRISDAESPTIMLSDLIMQINQDQMEPFNPEDIKATIMDMSNQGLNVWYQEDMDAVMFI